MKLQVTQENLTRALGTVARVANSRNPLPILSNVLLKTSNNRLSISATNLDIAITQYIGAKISEEGSITVPARLMQDFVGSLPSGVIDLKLEDSKLHIKTDQYNSVVNGIVADDFPVMPEITEGKTWSVPGQALKRGLQQVVFAASNDESRPFLTGVYMHTEDGNLYIAATDSYRLAEKNLGKNKEENVQLLIPATAMQDLLRILGDTDDVVMVTHDDQQILFHVGEVDLVARLLEGKYPDYRKLIPQQFAVSSTLKKVDFVNITKVSSLFARESAGSVTINVDEDTKEVSIRSIASQLGENTANASAAVTGSGSITLNSRYLLDGLQALGGDEVMFGFNGKLEATLLKDAKADDYVHIIMPLKS
ncbi:MAG TPA: DNA polymerase III subunit beta [Candidatus Saccharimonadales bacterium]|nr:DNA polymerase III subunit beta [Candidatus Saccharimonadales bacterium]